jgi:hypothetical protein
LGIYRKKTIYCTEKNCNPFLHSKLIIPDGLCSQAALHTTPNGKPDKAYCCGKMKAPWPQTNKKLQKHTPFSWAKVIYFKM